MPLLKSLRRLETLMEKRRTDSENKICGHLHDVLQYLKIKNKNLYIFFLNLATFYIIFYFQDINHQNFIAFSAFHFLISYHGMFSTTDRLYQHFFRGGERSEQVVNGCGSWTVLVLGFELIYHELTLILSSKTRITI